MSMKDISDLQVCLAVKAFRERDLDLPWPYEALAEATGQAEKVCYRAMERADRRGYLEYGVSLRTAWLTEKGEQLIAQGTSGSAQDAKRLDPQGAGPVRQDAPEAPLSTPLPSGSIER